MFIDYLPVHKQEQSLARLLGSKPMVLEVDRRCVLIVRFPLQGILVLLWRWMDANSDRYNRSMSRGKVEVKF